MKIFVPLKSSVDLLSYVRISFSPCEILCLLFLFTSIHLWGFSSGFASSGDSEIIYVLVVIYINMYTE